MRYDPGFQAAMRGTRARKMAPAATMTGSAAMETGWTDLGGDLRRLLGGDHSSGNASTRNIQASVSEAAEAADIQQGAVKGKWTTKRLRAETDRLRAERKRLLAEAKQRASERKAAVSVEPPRLGQFLICLFVPADRQAERLGDFEEMLRTLWVPRFGLWGGRVLYTAHAIRSAGAIVRIAAVAMLIDRVKGVLGF
jgi:hypothetical protein